MALILHIVIALVGLASALPLLFSPSRSKLYITGGLSLATVLSGFYLLATGSSLTHVCVSGAVYLAVVGYCVYAASRKLAGARVTAR